MKAYFKYISLAVKKHYYFVLLFLIPGNIRSQEYNIEFEHISIEDGLSQNTVFCIIQDRKGFMWFGTEEGLNKYDGYQFKIYRSSSRDQNSLKNDYVYSLFEDQMGIIWIGTRNGGLSRFDPVTGKLKNYLNDPNNKNSISDNVVRAIYEDSLENLWIGTENGMNRMNKVTEKFTRFVNDPSDNNSISDNMIYMIVEEKSGVLWISTANGLNRFDPKTNRFQVFKHDPEDLNSISNDAVLSIFKDSTDGVLWIGTEGGLNRLDLQTFAITRYSSDLKDIQSLSHNEIRIIERADPEHLWIGTWGGGLNKMNIQSGYCTSYVNDPKDFNSISRNRIWSLMKDRSGIFWLGTNAGGINKIIPKTKNFVHYNHNPQQPNSLSHNETRCIFEDNSGRLWIGTLRGLNRYNPKTEKFTVYLNDPENENSISSNEVRAIENAEPNYLWIGTYGGGGLNKMNIQNGFFTKYVNDPLNQNSISSNDINIIKKDNYGYVWIGTENGLNRFNPQTKTFKRFFHDPNDPQSISHDFILDIFSDMNGTIWVSTWGGGCNKYDFQTEKFQRFVHDFENPYSLSHNTVLCVNQDSLERYWMGTGGGLNQLDIKTGKFTSWTIEDGLPNNVVYGIIVDDRWNSKKNQYQTNIWFSTNKGISRFNVEQGIFRNYDISDGLQNNEFNVGVAFKGKDNHIYFGGINGFNKFHPDNIKTNNYIPPVVITDFQIFNKTVPVNENSVLQKSITYTNKVELSYVDRIFSFDFAALNYISSEKNQYAYIMENFEEEWNYVYDRRFATYTNLPPGDYIFRVKGSNNDNIWNEEGISLNITITPPLWQTWWFQVFLSIFIVILIFTAHRIRVSNIREKNKDLKEVNIKLNEQVSERKKLEKKAKRSTAQFALIYKAGQRVSSKLELDLLLSEIVTSIFETFNYEGVMLLLLNENQDHMVLQSVQGAYKGIFRKNMKFPIKEGMVGYTAKSGEIQISNDVSTNPHFVKEANENTNSELSVPIKSGDKIIGVLDIQSQKFNAFDETDVEAMETLNSQIASAIENANLYEKARQELLDRLNAEHALRQSEESFRSLAENAFDGIIISLQDGDSIYANRRAAVITGYTIDQLLKLRLKDLIPKNDMNKVMEILTLSNQGDSIKGIYESILIQKDGKEIPIEIAANKTSWYGENADMFFFRDITDRRRVEEEIQKTQKLESIGILAGGIAHDFNNRISIILGNAQIARVTSEQGGDITRYLQNIEEGTEQAKALTQQLLTFSMGGAPIKKVDSIKEVLKNSTRFSLSGSNVKCNFAIPHDIWPVEIDVGQIDQVIGNIIINANQAMPDGGTIHISVENIKYLPEDKLPLPKGNYIKIVIKDSGIGIQKKHLKKIFDPYFTTKSKGSGLGLTIAYSVIKNHGGLLNVESIIGSGTSFSIYIPASNKKIPKEEVHQYKPSIGKGKVLVMDDEELVREMAGDMLKSLGYEVGYARDGNEAIEQYKKDKESNASYDAVLMDLTIPGSMGGKEAIKKLIKIDPEVKVIVSSGYSNDPIMAEYKKYGFSGVIAKPYNIKELDEVLQKIILTDNNFI